MFLKDEHRPQSHSSLAAAADIDTLSLGPLQKLVTARTVPGDEGTLTLASEIEDLVRKASGETFEAIVEIVADASSMADEVEAMDFVDNGAEEDGACGIAHPGIELAIW